MTSAGTLGKHDAGHSDITTQYRVLSLSSPIQQKQVNLTKLLAPSKVSIVARRVSIL